MEVKENEDRAPNDGIDDIASQAQQAAESETENFGGIGVGGTQSVDTGPKSKYSYLFPNNPTKALELEGSLDHLAEHVTHAIRNNLAKYDEPSKSEWKAIMASIFKTLSSQLEGMDGLDPSERLIISYLLVRWFTDKACAAGDSIAPHQPPVPVVPTDNDGLIIEQLKESIRRQLRSKGLVEGKDFGFSEVQF